MGEWINVKDRLPELIPGTNNSRCVLIAKHIGRRAGKLTTTIGYRRRSDIMSDIFIWIDMVSRYEQLADVKYWQPLPDPPQVIGE